MFADTVLKIVGDEVAAIEVVQHLDELATTLKSRRADNFLSNQTAIEKQKLIDAHHSGVAIENICHEFYGNF